MSIRIIAVTGTPGTGKTTYAKKLAYGKGYLYFDVSSFIRQEGLSAGFDRRRNALIVDTDTLSNAIIRVLQAKRVTECIITKCSLKSLKKRLEKRGYSKTKVRENLDAEIFDVCYAEAKEMGHKVKVVWTG
jgi:adenylate kinase